MPRTAPQSNETTPEPKVDGRHAWRERNRLAVVDAILDLYAEGNLKPSVQEVADRSGVSRRSVFRYFDDLDDLDRTAIERQQARVRHLVDLPGICEGPLPERAKSIAAQRVALFSAIAPAARVSRLRARFHGVIGGELAASRKLLGRQVEKHFDPELSQLQATRRKELLAAADALLAFETYDLLSEHRGMSDKAIESTLATALVALFD
jgi:AcrR family transcriptional regulator